MRTSKVGKFFMGLLLAMICFCLGLLLMMDKVDACLVEEESVEPEVERVVPLVLEEKVSNKQMQAVPVPMVYIEATVEYVLEPVPEAEPAAEPEEETISFTYREEIPLSEELQEALWEACQEYSIDTALVLGVIEVESTFRTDAVSCVGCYGLMQLNPAYFPSDLSPAENIQHGVKFLAELLERYSGDEGAALTAYNAGHDTGSRVYAQKVQAAAERWREAEVPA